jgi:N-acetylglucosaminyldiphosphoundecaprenol N-acetyl-beta-D-mannosaminyltransferase
MDTPHVRGTDFMRGLILSAPKGSRHYFLGGTDETLNGIRKFITENRGSELSCKFESPEFDRAWDEISPRVLNDIKSYAPNFVWVGMGAPKQFYISAEIYEKLKLTSFSVGAAFDFIARTKRECPKLISNLGMEWLFRLLSEPRRLWRRYLIGNLEFVFYLLSDFTRYKKFESNKL